MHPHLHELFKTAAQITALLPNGGAPGEPETSQLDFKGMPWDKAKKPNDDVNFVCDVVALMNADGGSLLVGVAEDPATGLASGLSGLVGVDWRKTRDLMVSWLQQRLDPRDAESYVSIPSTPIMVNDKPVYAIEVAPCPFAPIAVLDGDPEHRVLHIPVRMKNRNDFMTLSEAVKNMDTRARRTLLDIKDIQKRFGDDGVFVRVDHGISIKLPEGRDPIPVLAGMEQYVATVGKLTPETLVLTWCESRLASAITLALRGEMRARVPGKLQTLAMTAASKGGSSRTYRDSQGYTEEDALGILKPQFDHIVIVATNFACKGSIEIPLREIRSVYPWYEQGNTKPRLGLILDCKLLLSFDIHDRPTWVITG